MQFGMIALADRYPRRIGTVLLGVGLILAKWQIYDAISIAQQGKQQVTVSSRLVATAILALVCGIPLVLFGRRPIQWLRFDPRHLTVKDTICLVGLGLTFIVVFVLVFQSLESQGLQLK